MLDWGEPLDRLIFMCSPGMGKSAVTLKILSDRLLSGQNKGFAIISPLRVSTITWPDQVARWQHSSWMRVANMRTKEGAEAWENGSADIYLINYEMLASRDVRVKCKVCAECGEGCDNCHKGVITRHHPGFVEKFIAKRKTLPVDGIVWDELSLTRNPASKRINAIRPYLHDTKTKTGKPYKSPFTFHAGLTGTPICKDYRDLFAQIRLIDGGERLGTFVTHYLKEHFEVNPWNRYDVKIRPGSKEIIDKKISDLCLVMLGDDYLDLPQTLSEDVMVEMPAAARKVYETLEDELLVELENGEIEALSAAALTTKLQQVTSGCAYDNDRNVHAVHDAKLKALTDLRKKHKNEPILVLCAFKHEYQRILDAIPGSRMFDEKDLPLWKQGKIKTWVANVKSLSHGIDGIQKGGRIAVWFSQTWSNEAFLQTNARLIRTGQSAETIIYRILVRSSIDEAIAESLRAKDGEQQGLFNALKALQLLRKSA